MAATGTPTPNIGLRRAQGTDPASVDDINYNSALIDTKLGAVGNSSVQDQIDTLNSNLSSYIVTEQFNKSYSVEANNNVSVEYTNISKTGYTPIGIIGFNTRIGAVVPFETGISQDGTKAYMSLRNVTSTARTENALIVVAYIKNF